MKPLIARLVLAAGLLVVTAMSAHAQATRAARLTVTVVDQTQAVIPNATVTLVGLEDATRRTAVPAGKTSEKGIAVFQGLLPGRYSIQGEFPGFELGLVRDVRLRAGDNKHVVVLPLQRMTAEVTVGRDPQAAASDRAGTFGTALTREQIESLSDDPDEMRRQLQDMAGPGAVLRVDSFEGQQLPPKAQIKAIHITRDMFAAENHTAGGIFVDIITQPGIGALRGGVNLRFYDSALEGRNPLIPEKGPAQSTAVMASLSGSLIKNRSSFSVSFNSSRAYTTPNLYAATPVGTRAELLNLRSPSNSFGVNALVDYALTRDQTLRLSVSGTRSTSENLGAGGYNLAERTYSTENRYYSLRLQEAGPIGRRFFINTRLAIIWNEASTRSALEAPTIVVSDAFTSGGAQRSGSQRNRTFSLASDLDYVRGIHSWRAGVLLNGGWYRSDDASNYLGTFVFESLAAYQAGTPRTYTRRVGDPLIDYVNLQAGVYVQDDIRVSKTLTLSPGVRVEAQTHLDDVVNIGPRFGITWAPFKGGRTTLRGSWGIFYDWLGASIYEQTLRVDGLRQQELNIVSPTFPDPGVAGNVSLTNRYLLGGSIPMARNVRVSAGIDQQITKALRLNVTYANIHADGQLVGRNLNAPVAGVRPDPTVANVIETVGAGEARSHTVNTSLSLNLGTFSPMAATSGPWLSWRRGLMVMAGYGLSKSDSNTDGAFSVPATGDLEAEWGPAPGDVRHRFSMILYSGALKNFTAMFSVSASTGMPYTILTGFDDNGDSIFNDRPVGVGRNTERTGVQWNSYGMFSYSLGIGKRQVQGPGGIFVMGGPGGAVSVGSVGGSSMARYQVTFNVNVQNLTNHANYVGYSGVMTSPFFRQPTAVAGVRRIDLSIGFRF